MVETGFSVPDISTGSIKYVCRLTKVVTRSGSRIQCATQKLMLKFG